MSISGQRFLVVAICSSGSCSSGGLDGPIDGDGGSAIGSCPPLYLRFLLIFAL